MNSTQARNILLRMTQLFPGLIDHETPVDGADLVEWLTLALQDAQKDDAATIFARGEECPF